MISDYPVTHTMTWGSETADQFAEGITRCKDCKWRMAYVHATYCDRFKHALPTEGGFCAWGERKVK